MSPKTRTILIVDDSPEDRELYRRYLLRDREYSYTIVEASLGRQGLELWQQHQPDAVLLDYRLPDLDGLQFLAQMPQTQQLCLPVIVVTGQGNEAIAVQAIKAGAQDYLIKGQITPESLHLAVNGAIEAVQLRTQLQQHVERERLVAQITRLLHQSLDLEQILQTTVTQVRQFLQSDRVLIFRLQSDGSGIVTTESVGSQWTPLLSTSLYDPCFNENYIEFFCQGLVTVKPDIHDGSINPCHVELLAQLQVRANLVVPILQDNLLWGLLIVHHCAAPRQWQPLEIDLLKELATQAGIAIQQAELYQLVKSELAQRQQAESALQIANAQLEERAAVLAASNEELQVAMEELEVAEEELRTQNEHLAIAQTKVELQRQRYQALFEFAPDGYLVTDERGVIQEANATAVALLQMSLGQLIGQPLNAFIPKQERQAFHNQLYKWLTADRFAIPRQTWELNLQPHRGQAFPVEVSLAQEVEPSQCLRWLIRDITKRKQAEAALRESEEITQGQLAEIEAIYTAAPIGLCFIDTDLRFVRINEQLAKINGLPVSEHIGRNVRDVLPEMADQLEPLYRQVIESGEPILNLEVRGTNRAQPGVERHWLVSYYPQKDGGNHVLGVNVMVQEITERKIAGEAVRQSQERYQYLAELIPQLVWTASGEGMLLDVNQRWSDYTGLTLAQAQTCGWEVVIHPDDIPILQQQWATAVETGIPYQAEGRMRRADGVYRWHLHQAMPQRNEQGQIIWFGTATDIEAQKQLDVERDRLLALEQTARAEAERANRIKDEFLAILSHELRSPLNPILGWTKLLQTRKFDQAKTEEALATIERNVKLQAQLIDDLLDVARILRGKLTLNAAAVNLVVIIESAIETVKTAAIAKSILIHPVLPQMGQVSGDPMRLQQIVWNLLSNAIKFTPKGGRVSIHLERRNSQVQITVTDTGKGISPDFLPHIFECFRQEDASITRKYGGLGLGLAIVRSLVEAHGGTISAASLGEGQGATFTVRLPLFSVEDQSDRADDSLNGELDLTGIRVLLVDDEPDTRDLLAFVLKEYGAEVMAVASASEVLPLLESFKADVLVSDIGMPQIDGYTLLRQVRSLPPERGGQIPAIAITAYARVEDQQKALSAGFQGHISKPVDPSRLIVAISDLLSLE